MPNIYTHSPAGRRSGAFADMVREAAHEARVEEFVRRIEAGARPGAPLCSACGIGLVDGEAGACRRCKLEMSGG